ncbi:MAG: hypothetical protein ACRDTR_03315 [Rubrobacter sp.]
MVRRSVVVFVSAFLLGAWSASLAHNPLPERLASAFTWFAGGIVGVLLVAVVVARVFLGD